HATAIDPGETEIPHAARRAASLFQPAGAGEPDRRAQSGLSIAGQEHHGRPQPQRALERRQHELPAEIELLCRRGGEVVADPLSRLRSSLLAFRISFPMVMNDTEDLVPGALRPKDAATLIRVKRDGGTPRVLMGCRSAGMAFMANKYVFPGGRMDPGDQRIAVAHDLRPAVLARAA